MRTDNSMIDEWVYTFTDSHPCQRALMFSSGDCGKFLSENISSTLAFQRTGWQRALMKRQSMIWFSYLVKRNHFSRQKHLPKWERLFRNVLNMALCLIKQCHLFGEWQGHNFYSKNNSHCQNEHTEIPIV